MANPTINWATKVISVPQSFLTPLGGSLYQLDTDAFRLALKDIEDSEEGITMPDTHRHNTSVLLGGIQYARIVEIINGYTVTFEDTGTPYTVTLIGSNNNILEVTNLGSVQILSNNSAGLINVLEVQQSAYNGRIHIDAANTSGKAVSGTTYPAGTHGSPCLTLADAMFIAAQRGLTAMHVMGDLTLNSGDNVTEWHIHGEGATLNATRTKITFTSGCITTGAHFYDSRITGVQGGEANFHECIIDGMSNAHCHFDRCGFETELQTYSVQHHGTVSGTHVTDLHNCYGGVAEIVVDRNGTRLNQRWIRFCGSIKFINQNRSTESGTVHINMTGGTVTIDSSCTTGSFVISGVCTVVNNSGGATVDTSQVTATSAGGIDYTALGNAVWSHVSAVQVVNRLSEAWARLGLDPTKPLISGQTEISFGDVVMALVGDETSSTLTRQ